MPRLRKTLVATAIAAIAIAIAVVLLLLLFANKDSNKDVLWQHIDNIWTGKTNLVGNRRPGELIRYTKHRLQGHPNLEMLVLPPLHWVQARYERPVPAGPLPALGKGQQKQSLTPSPNPAGSDILLVQTPEDLASTVSVAKAGQTIVLMPGTYRIGRTIKTASAGSGSQPITVKAIQPGQVIIEFLGGVGFNVAHPFWTFENLNIRGACAPARYCEHAFHIFGPAQGVIIRNNHIQDFNAHIKVNGLQGQWPDNGLVQNNTLTNSQPRDGMSSVTPIDLVGADNWKVLDNVISNFAKYGGNQISYGVFMKGNSHHGRIERNLIICTTQDISQPGVRVGISFGGGTTGTPYCRDQNCDVEHSLGLAANNIVAHCNDVGIDVNRSKDISIAHNTLINTAGLGVRGKQAVAKVYGNHIEGLIREKDGASLQINMNESGSMTDYFVSPDELDLHWLSPLDNIPSLSFVGSDFCGNRRLDGTPPGALISQQACK